MKPKPTKTETSKLTRAQQAEIDALAALSDDEIDTSDIPEVRDWSGAERGKFYRPIKRQLTLRIDADIVEWFKHHAQDEGYQTTINRALREHVERHAKEDSLR
jgi:uncharacterized protein (DUF4415 family)